MRLYYAVALQVIGALALLVGLYLLLGLGWALAIGGAGGLTVGILAEIGWLSARR